MHGVILAGGTGSRLYPLTHTFNKHLLSVHNKFIIDYPLQSLKELGCTDVTVILGGSNYSQIVSYIKDGEKFSFNINYIFQKEPLGIAHGINLCKNILKNEDKFITILGDNVFDKPIQFLCEKPQIILSPHFHLNKFGVCSLDSKKIVKIEEKPAILDSRYENYAITGCYLFDGNFFDYFNKLTISKRNEYEIAEIINFYHKDNNLNYSIYDSMWSDAGTFESINYLNNYFFNKKI